MREGETNVGAALDSTGLVRLSVNGEGVKTGHVPGTLVEQPLDGLQVGQDAGGEVGDYREPFEFDGKVGSLVIEVSISPMQK